ncbi:stress response protein NST1-like [Hibiscus syriacus]|uniref:stress response protein NST1-like n=1 Tax=Hibiscus syriacus TaxID=106335 RepID=UPI001921FE39|nr:stress response protein NST1-like [Hibiscus syriacus]
MVLVPSRLVLNVMEEIINRDKRVPPPQIKCAPTKEILEARKKKEISLGGVSAFHISECFGRNGGGCSSHARVDCFGRASFDYVRLSTCCQVWKNKYSKAERGRVCLKQAVRLLEKGCDNIQAENLALKQAYEEKQTRTNVEKEGREKESALRVSLENEISVLKSEISNLKQKGVSDVEDKIGEIKLLRATVSVRDKEISWLKELVENDKKRVDLEKKNAAYAPARTATECKAGEEYRLKQLETLRKEISKAKSKLALEKSKLDEETKKLEEEKKKAVEERKLVDLEMAKARELRKIAEETKKKAVGERKLADIEMAEAAEQRKIAEENMKKAVEVRKQAEFEMAEAEEQRKIAEETKKAVE